MQLSTQERFRIGYLIKKNNLNRNNFSLKTLCITKALMLNPEIFRLRSVLIVLCGRNSGKNASQSDKSVVQEICLAAVCCPSPRWKEMKCSHVSWTASYSGLDWDWSSGSWWSHRNWLRSALIFKCVWILQVYMTQMFFQLIQIAVADTDRTKIDFAFLRFNMKFIS